MEPIQDGWQGYTNQPGHHTGHILQPEGIHAPAILLGCSDTRNSFFIVRQSFHPGPSRFSLKVSEIMVPTLLAQAAGKKYHRLGGLNNRILFSHNSGI